MVVTILLLLIISGVGAVPFIFFVHWVEPHNMPICLSSYLVCATSWILTLLLLGWFVPFIFFVYWAEPHNMPICLSSYLVCAASWILTLLLMGWFARKAERERISNMRKDGLSENMIVLTNEKNN